MSVVRLDEHRAGKSTQVEYSIKIRQDRRGLTYTIIDIERASRTKSGVARDLEAILNSLLAKGS